MKKPITHEQVNADNAHLLTRTECITWLSKNDPNGTYNDKDSRREFGSILGKKQAVQIIISQLQNS